MKNILDESQAIKKDSRKTMMLLSALGMLTILQIVGVTFQNVAYALREEWFDVGPLYYGDCTVKWGTFTIFSDGTVQWQAFAFSNSDDDAWGLTGIQITDDYGNLLFTVPDMWSPTLPVYDYWVNGDANWVSYGWLESYQPFASNWFDRIAHIHYNYQC